MQHNYRLCCTHRLFAKEMNRLRGTVKIISMAEYSYKTGKGNSEP